jgi:hypothetical protein
MKISTSDKVFYGMMLAFASIMVSVMLFGGCSTNQTTAAYKGEVVTDTAVKTAMTGWGVYVQLYHPGTNAETQVLHAFNSMRAAELTVVDATESLASNPTNTAPLQAAENALAASQADLVTLIGSLTNNPNIWTNTVR